jgi:SPP1 gp7 family putative phage head morphogenesis protein
MVMQIPLPPEPAFPWQQPWKWADAAKQREAQNLFAPSRSAELAYERQLRAVAGQVKTALTTTGGLHQAEKLLREYAKIIGPWARQSAANMLLGVQRKNDQAWRAIAGRMGLDMRALFASPGIGEAMQERIAENAALITSLPLDAANKAAAIAQESLATGSRAEDLAKRIHGLGNMTLARARTIARTEVSKAGVALTLARAADVGSEGYIWRTARDGDTRPSHRAMEGKFVRWDSPQTIDMMSGHAGEFPNCRCYPEPVVPREGGGVYRPPLPTQAQERNAGVKQPISRWEKQQAQAAQVSALEHALGIQKGNPLDIAAATRGANPNFGKGKEYQINCQRCVPAYELRRRGYAVEALPIKKGNFGPVRLGAECFDGAQITGWPFDPRGLTLQQLTDQLDELPEGARASVLVRWNARSGHTFVCEKGNGVLRFIDPQSGRDGSGSLTPRKKFGFFRMDNLTLRETLDWKLVVKAGAE